MSEFSKSSERDPGADPIVVFESWYAEAKRKNLEFFDAFSLATATRSGKPSVRTVLFKGLWQGRVRFVTNYDSRKGRELNDNPAAAAVFFWPGLARQVRFEGRVTRAAAEASDRYFASRDRESQLGAWASDQSRPIATRADLEARLEATRARFADGAVPRPPHWGLLELEPERIELWQSGEHRLHDRFAYERRGAVWSVERLAP
jgi:pyridoxamine 5'-phosphate oxidase